MNSCLYQGTVEHRRTKPRRHTFRYTLFMMYLDLNELPELFDKFWLWSARRPALAWFRRSDYFGERTTTIDDAVRNRVTEATGIRPNGPIRMLTHLRYFGYIMNPVTFYYIFNADDTGVETILAEITNTPWNERHTYVLSATENALATKICFIFDKTFHVSPFMDMNHKYAWQFTEPGDRLVAHMENYQLDDKVFDATLTLARRDITTISLAMALLRYPWMTAKVAAGIYWQAVRLWTKRIPFFVHPSKRTS